MRAIKLIIRAAIFPLLFAVWAAAAVMVVPWAVILWAFDDDQWLIIKDIFNKELFTNYWAR